MKYFNNVKELAALLEKKGQKLNSLNSNELSKIEKLNNKQLPSTYKSFLEKMGKGAGQFMEGSSVFYDEIFELHERAVKLIEENNFRSLPSDAFVFWMHQGYQMAFFTIGESDNPIIYYYSETEGMTDFRKDGTLLEFLEIQLAMSFPEFEL